MSTSSFIGRKNLDGSVLGITCHYDGDIAGNGIILDKYYNDSEKVNTLIRLGALSSLGPKTGRKVDFHNPGEALLTQCIAYNRDRGDTLEFIKHRNDKTSMRWRQEFIYIYDTKDNTWYVYDHDANRIKLKTVIQDACETNKNHIIDRLAKI